MWVRDAAHEALRDLVRAREAAKKDQLRARNRLSKFLLRKGAGWVSSGPSKNGGRFLIRVQALRQAVGARVSHLYNPSDRVPM